MPRLLMLTASILSLAACGGGGGGGGGSATALPAPDADSFGDSSDDLSTTGFALALDEERWYRVESTVEGDSLPDDISFEPSISYEQVEATTGTVEDPEFGSIPVVIRSIEEYEQDEEDPDAWVRDSSSSSSFARAANGIVHEYRGEDSTPRWVGILPADPQAGDKWRITVDTDTSFLGMQVRSSEDGTYTLRDVDATSPSGQTGCLRIAVNGSGTTFLADQDGTVLLDLAYDQSGTAYHKPGLDLVYSDITTRITRAEGAFAEDEEVDLQGTSEREVKQLVPDPGLNLAGNG